MEEIQAPGSRRFPFVLFFWLLCTLISILMFFISSVASVNSLPGHESVMYKAVITFTFLEKKLNS